MSDFKRCITFDEAGEALTKNRGLRWDATNVDVRQADGEEVDLVIGAGEVTRESADRHVQVAIEGPAKIDVGATLPYGTEFTFDSNGKAVPLTSAEHKAVGIYDAPKMDSSHQPKSLVSGERHDLTLYRNKNTKPLGGARRTLQFEYDFDDDGGAISTIDLGVDVPAGAVIMYSHYEVITTFTSATDAATIALKAGTATINAAVAISDGSNVYDDGLFDGDHDNTAANAEKLAADGNLELVIAVEAVTAGKLVGEVEYYYHPE